MGHPSTITTDEVVYDDYTDSFYKAFGTYGGTPIHFHRGRCMEEIEDEDGTERTCSFRAAVRRVNEDGIEDYCKRHAPEGWLNSLDGRTQLDNTLIDLRAGCEKWVSGNPDGNPTPAQDKTEQHPKGTHQCGDRAVITVALHDRNSKSFCRTHARKEWVERLRVETGVPEDALPEGDGDDDYVFIDIPSGTQYDSHSAWSEGVNGSYPDIFEAERYVAVFSEDDISVHGTATVESSD